MSETTTPEQPRCANCGAPLHGDFCYACGQPVKGLIRHLSGVVGDFLDSVLNLDSRTFRSLGPLFCRPGYLTLEYFAGRRVRYVTPLRLFFFLCVVAFFAAQLYLDASGNDGARLFERDRGEHSASIAGAQTPEEVQQRLDHALAGMDKSLQTPGMPESARTAVRNAETAVRKQAERRLAYLKSVQEARAHNQPLPPEPDADADEDVLSFDGTPWDPKAHPIAIAWLPKLGNDKLNDMAGRMRDNLRRAKQEPKRLVTGLFGVLPQTLFVLMPLFAVLLKVVYLFKRRLYMEHLIVALHSHAFIFAALLLMALLGLAQIWLKDVATWAVTPLGWAVTLTAWWIPLYLLLMQKRVYRQGWTMTVLKFGLIGTCYSIMIVLALAAAFVVSLAVE
ncbi:MAG TPA: DUF3667 domain-containing protein [Rhodanobacteraceae bacterium]|nr:DUF3667 domain-containing protein [Rhodanobacteraceae bacterium]